MSSFKYGLCDCCKPMNLMCCYSIYCSPCAFYDMAEELQPGTGVMHLVLGIIFPLAPMIMLRGQARERDALEGGMVGDLCSVCCCPACAHIQTYKQVDPQKSLMCGDKTVSD